MKWCLYFNANSLHWRFELTGSYLMVLAHFSKTTISEKGAFGLEIVEKVVSIDSALKLGDDIHFESPPQGISRTMNGWSLVKIDQSIRSRIHMWKKGREIRKKSERKSKQITPSDNYWLLSFFRTRSCSSVLGRTSPLTITGVRKESPYRESNSAVESLTDFRCDATLSVMRQPTWWSPYHPIAISVSFKTAVCWMFKC